LLKDEIDYLRNASDKAAKLEATIESYKAKLKELGDLRGQVRIFYVKHCIVWCETLHIKLAR